MADRMGYTSPPQFYPQHRQLRQQQSQSLPGQHNNHDLMQTSHQGPYTSGKRKAIIGLAISQIVLGTLSMIFGLTSTAVGVETYEWNISLNSIVGVGLWAGLFIIITGVFGVIASRKNTSGQVIVCLVMNLVCSAFSGVLFLMSLAALIIGSANMSEEAALTAMDVLTMLIGLAQVAITTISSVIGCQVTCCQRNRHYLASDHGPYARDNAPLLPGEPALTTGVPYYGATQPMHGGVPNQVHVIHQTIPSGVPPPQHSAPPQHDEQQSAPPQPDEQQSALQPPNE